LRFGVIISGAVVLLAFAIIYSLSLSFVYIEGDDASLIAYHALGRNPSLQPPYSAYVSMMDAVLALLPARENVIRIAAITLTAVSAPIFFFLMMLLAFEWCDAIDQPPKWVATAVMLMAVPEFYYLSMVLTPSIIAMALLLVSHLIVRRSAARVGSFEWAKFAVSLLLFGLGAAFRWDTVTYGATIVADLFYSIGDRSPQGPPPPKKRLLLSILWGAGAGITWLLVLRFNGWDLGNILHVLRANGPVESLDWKMGIARVQPFFTPAFTILFVVGYYLLVRGRNRLAIIVIVATLPVAKLMLYGVPKWFITATPAFVACAIFGLGFCWQRRALRYSLLGLVIGPWFIGVHWSLAGIGWGPGFELRSYERTPDTMSLPYLSLSAGMAVPTPEGPRPLFGHAWVLSGAWKRFVNEYESEQEMAVKQAIDAGLPLLVAEDGTSWFVCVYAARDYFTQDSGQHEIADFVIERRWIASNGSQSRLISFSHPKDLFNPAAIQSLRRVAPDTVVVSGFSSNLIRLHQIAPESLELQGKRTALLHLDRLAAKLTP